MNTTGFKRQRAEFQDLLYQDLRRVGSTSSDTGTVVPSGAQVGLGVRTAAVYRIDEQGNLQQTSNKLDLAISGNGFLQVTLPSGDTAYTRDGTLALSAGGTIVTADGYLVQPGITIPSNTTNVTINADGEVLATIPGQVAQQNVGQLQLAAFPNDAGLEATGGNLFLQTSASGTAQVGIPGTNGLGTVMQGFVETSNVNVVSEMTNLITAQRAYEMNSRVISASDDMLSTITKLH